MGDVTAAQESYSQDFYTVGIALRRLD